MTTSIIKAPALLKTDDFILNIDTDQFDNITVELLADDNKYHQSPSFAKNR